MLEKLPLGSVKMSSLLWLSDGLLAPFAPHSPAWVWGSAEEARNYSHGGKCYNLICTACRPRSAPSLLAHSSNSVTAESSWYSNRSWGAAGQQGDTSFFVYLNNKNINKHILVSKRLKSIELIITSSRSSTQCCVKAAMITFCYCLKLSRYEVSLSVMFVFNCFKHWGWTMAKKLSPQA